MSSNRRERTFTKEGKNFPSVRNTKSGRRGLKSPVSRKNSKQSAKKLVKIANNGSKDCYMSKTTTRGRKFDYGIYDYEPTKDNVPETIIGEGFVYLQRGDAFILVPLYKFYKDSFYYTTHISNVPASKRFLIIGEIMVEIVASDFSLKKQKKPTKREYLYVEEEFPALE